MKTTVQFRKVVIQAETKNLIGLSCFLFHFRELSMLVNERQDNWDIHLEATLFSLRSKVNTATKFTPFMLMYGREAALPSEVPIDMPVSFCV